MPTLLPSGIVKVPVTPLEDCLQGGRAIITLRPDFSFAPVVPVVFDLSQIQPNNIDDIRGLYIENNHLDDNGQQGDVSIALPESGFNLIVPFGAVLAVPLWLTAYGSIQFSVTPKNSGQSGGLPFVMLTNFPVVPFFIQG
jgi:hypothetical protein